MNAKSAALLALLILSSGLFGYLTATKFAFFTHMLSSSSLVYNTQPNWLNKDTKFETIGWEQLIPEQERGVLSQYQINASNALQDLTSQVLNSIRSASDKAYQQALISTNTVADIASKTVAISGFVVPLDFHENKDLKSFFIVPYFGACVHFPPPPPNQILFAQLKEGFSSFDINQAYTFSGQISIQLFEDMIGTSAYAIDVNAIHTFIGEPDSFREHGL